MITKELGIAIDTGSWGKRLTPTWAVAGPLTHTIDVSRALLMLGSLTTPNGLSPGSPERYWACIRYFSACTDSPDLRIRNAFMDLDPHQKGILSDDFGVAIATSWLVDQLGGVRDIVDGRQFMINMGIRRAKRSKSLPKVGRSKCPDFVMEDQYGKLHVLECKGTQSGRHYLDRAMATGKLQKYGIEVAQSLRGESLVIGLSLAGQGSDQDTELVVIDPERDPLTKIRASDARKAEEVLTRLSLARALNLSGFSQMAFEMAWPEKLDKDGGEIEFLTPGERRGLAVKPAERQVEWQEEYIDELYSRPDRQVGDFITQQNSFDLPAIHLDSGNIAKRIKVRRGIRMSFIEEMAKSGEDLRAAASNVSSGIVDGKKNISFTQTDDSSRLDYDKYFFSEIVFD